ncbi:flagellar filament capping protein FliD [Actinotalea sp.]|uniref:flagellar filament capping protein FliD n=1 Tax=Actinotalea sp. TaxID=1872145 RepID=UPI00356AEEBD
MTSAIDGLVSGLDTTSLITSLMKIEAAPQTLLKTKQSTAEKLVSALQSLNTKVASLATAATSAAKAGSWNAFTVSSSTSAATAVAGSTATEGSISFAVDRLATSQISLSAPVANDGSFVSGPLTVKKADGTYVTVEPASSSLADVAWAVNQASDAGVRATVVQLSSGSTATYRLQFTGTTTGADNSFEVYAGTVDASNEASATRLDTSAVRTAQDAQITLWKGSASEQQVTQSSNTFTGLLTGVDVTVSTVTAGTEDPITLTVERDPVALTELASNLVTNIGVVFSEISSRTKTTTSSDEDGRTLVSGGLFSGDSAIRSLKDQLSSAMSWPVNGSSPSAAGITIDRYGSFSFDADAFATALAADPDKVAAIVSGLAARVQEVAETASASTTGTLSTKITSQQSRVSDFASQIESWDVRLELRRTALEKTYAALEVSLSNLNAQSSWLTSQLESLSTTS